MSLCQHPSAPLATAQHVVIADINAVMSLDQPVALWI